MRTGLNPRIEPAPIVAVLVALLPLLVAAHPSLDMQLWELSVEPPWASQEGRFDTPNFTWRVEIGDQVSMTSPDGSFRRTGTSDIIATLPHRADVDVCTTGEATVRDVQATMMLLAEMEASVVVRNAGALPPPCSPR